MKRRNLMMHFLVLTLLVPAVGSAQQRQAQNLFLPNVSPQARVDQTVGMTDISVSYHRPVVNERDIWGALVPYGQVWRTGANENTVISFSTDVMIEGQALAAGSYGLHTQPGEEEWEIIFSNDSGAWGSFAYDAEHDALRVKVEPETADFQEALGFSFDDPGSDEVTLALRWEKLRVPVKIAAATDELVLASIREQVTGLAGFFWASWNQAANYCLQNEINLEEAVEWADRSIGIERRFTNLSTKSQLLAKMGKEDEAAEIIQAALGLGNGGELHNYARQLLGRDEKQEALAVFQRNVEQNPDAWFVELGLARGYSALGDFDKAAENMRKAVERAPDNQKEYVQGLVDQLESETDIN